MQQTGHKASKLSTTSSMRPSPHARGHGAIDWPAAGAQARRMSPIVNRHCDAELITAQCDHVAARTQHICTNKIFTASGAFCGLHRFLFLKLVQYVEFALKLP